MAGDEAGVGHRSGTDHPGLQLGQFDQGGLDAFLDCANLRGDFVSGVFDHLFAHDGSFPGAVRRSAVGLI